MVAWRWWLRWTASRFAVGSREADDGRRSARMTAAHLRRRARLVMALRSRAQVQVSMYPPLPVELPALGTTYPLHPLMLMYGCVSRSSSSCSSMLLGFSTWSVCVGWGSVSAMVVHVREIRNSTLSSATMAEGATQGGNARQGRLVRAQCSTETGSELAKPRMVQHETQGCYVR